MGNKIETGVDKLLYLVNTKKELTLDIASKELNIDKQILEHWVSALCDAGELKIKYSFSKTYLLPADNNKNEAAYVLQDMLSNVTPKMPKFNELQVMRKLNMILLKKKLKNYHKKLVLNPETSPELIHEFTKIIEFAEVV